MLMALIPPTWVMIKATTDGKFVVAQDTARRAVSSSSPQSPMSFPEGVCMSWFSSPPVPCVLLCVLLCAACSDTSGSTPKENNDNPSLLAKKQAVLAQLSSGVIEPTLATFVEDTTALDVAVSALVSEQTEGTQSAARQAYAKAQGTWQRAELYQIGPLGKMEDVSKGQGLRDEIYSWPIVSACKVDQELVANAFSDTTAFAARLPNVRGLDALGYLLFSEGTDNACSANSSINTDGSWAALDAQTLSERRVAYAKTLSTLLSARAAALLTSWRDDFGPAYTAAGTAKSDAFGSVQEALNATSDALFYLEKETKDMKLGGPAGVTQNCQNQACEIYIEAPFTGLSKAHIVSNLEAFNAAYLGHLDGAEDGPGFDDLLLEVGAEDVDTQMRKRLDDALAAAKALPEDMKGATAAGDPKLGEAYDAIKSLTDLVRTQFISVLDLELPQRAEGDND